eukprot:2364190-Rhodomonas_salina.1
MTRLAALHVVRKHARRCTIERVHQGVSLGTVCQTEGVIGFSAPLPNNSREALIAGIDTPMRVVIQPARPVRTYSPYGAIRATQIIRGVRNDPIRLLVADALEDVVEPSLISV